jgi:hypothetical protein
MKKWSPGTLYREVHRSPTEILYEYPSLLEAGLLMGIIAAELAVTALFSTAVDGECPKSVAGLFALCMAVVVIPRAWDQRALRIRLVDQQLQYLRRSPFRDTQETVRFSELKAVLVEVANPRDSESEKEFDIALLTASGSRIHLGRQGRHATTRLGRALSRVLRIPLRLAG